MWRWRGWVVGVLAVVVAAPGWAADLNRNPGAIPQFAKSAGAWTAGHVLTVDSGGNTATFAAAASGSGDITDVWGCATGNCNGLTAAAGDSLDAGSADSSRPATRSTSLPGTCAEGQLHQDTDSGGTETYVCTATNTWTKALAGVDLDTSAELAALVGDETGSGALVFGTAPTLGSPAIADFTSAQHDHQDADDGGTLSITAATSGTLTLARGGTNATSWTANRCVRVNSAGTALEVHGSDCGSAVAAPETAEYVTLSTNGTLTAERVLTAGTLLDLTDAGAGSTVTFDWDSTEGNDFTWGDGTDATIQRTYNVSTGTDPVLQFGNGTVNVSTGTLQQGGTAVVLQSRQVIAGTGMSGGGALSSDVTLNATLGTAIDTSEITDGTIGFADVDATATLAGNPAFGTSSVWFGTTGLLFEGSTSDTAEGLLTAPSISADRTWTLPNVSGTLITTGDTATVTTGMIDPAGNISWLGTHAFAQGVRLAENPINGSDYYALVAPASIASSATFTWMATGQCTGTNGGALTIDASNNITCTDDDTGGVTGSGTDEQLARWDGTSALQGSALSITDAGLATLTSSSSATSGNIYGFTSTLTGTATSGTTVLYGVNGSAVASPASGTLAEARGVYGIATSDDAGAVTTLVGFDGGALRSGAGVVTSAIGIRAAIANTNASGSITTGYGVKVDPPLNFGTISTYHPLYVDGSGTSYLAGKLGIGSTTAPHGGTGYAMVALDGTNASAAGPHVQFTTASDNYPLLQILPYQHDNVGICFDCYFDGVFRAGDSGTGTAYLLYKGGGSTPDKLNLLVASGTTQGAAPTFVSAMLTGSGDVVFNEDSADRDLRIETDNVASALVVNAGADTIEYGVPIDGSIARTDTSGTVYLQRLLSTLTPGSATTADIIGDYVGLTANGSNALSSGATLTSVYGVAASNVSAASTGAGVYGVVGWARKTGTGQLGRLYGLYAQTENAHATGAVDEAYGLYFADSITTGTLTADYALFTAGDEPSRFGGAVGIKTAAAPTSGSELDVVDASAEAYLRLASAGTNTDARLELVTANESWDVYVDESDSQRWKLQSDTASQLLQVETSGLTTIQTSADVVSLVLTDSATNSANKEARLGVTHYTNSEEPLALVTGESTSSTGVVRVGGGFSQLNGATQVSLFTAANNTTVTGTERLRLNSGGDVKLGADISDVFARLHVETAAVGSDVLRLESTATGDDPAKVFRQGRTTTTDATTASVDSFALAASNAWSIEAEVIARRTGGSAGTAEDVGVWRLRGAYNVLSGTATAADGSTPQIDFESDNQDGWTATLGAGAGACGTASHVCVRVTGAANNNITWHSHIWLTFVGS